MVKAKKHLGQHFLTDLSIAEKTADYLLQSNPDIIIEVGFGKGVLTQFLLEKYGDKVMALDVDEESLAYMQKHFSAHQSQFILQDFLSFDLHPFKDDIAVIGNFPYNISSQIVFKVLENVSQVAQFCGMFQKEVAKRLCAEKGTKDYGILSVLLNTFYQTQYCFDIGPNSFMPPPKVNSGVIYAERKKDIKLPIPYSFYKTVVKTSFNQRRKMLRNSLSSLGINKIKDSEYFTLRPEQLSFVEFISLSEKLYQVQ